MRSVIAAFALAATATPAAFLPGAATAQEETVTWYDVELIVFRHVDARTRETWPSDAGTPDVAEARPLFPPPEADTSARAAVAATSETPFPAGMPMPTPYVPLDTSARQLNGVHASLQRSSRFEPLLHVAWTQPPLERNQAPYLRLTLPGSLEPVAEEAELDEDTSFAASDQPILGREDDGQRLALDQETPAFLANEDDQGTPFARPLDGRVQLSVSRYLHLDLDLLFLPENINPALLGNLPAATREWTEEDKRRRDERRRQILDALARGDLTVEEAEILAIEPERDMFEGFRLNQFRRLRSRELHYFDHPVYGVIATVTPRQVSARTLDTEAIVPPGQEP